MFFERQCKNSCTYVMLYLSVPYPLDLVRLDKKKSNKTKNIYIFINKKPRKMCKRLKTTVAEYPITGILSFSKMIKKKL